MDRLDQSLDSIIAARPKPERGPKKGGRGGTGGRGNKQGSKTVFRSSEKKGSGKVKASSDVVIRKPGMKKQISARIGNAGATRSVFDRLGSGASAQSGVSGTLVKFANLKTDIVSADIAELCSSVGEVKQVDVILNKSGRSTGVADVFFARRSDANIAVKKFHGLTLDGVPMKVSLAGKNGQPNPFNPLPHQEEGNKKAGFFGTALDDDDDDVSDGFRGRGGGGRGRGGRAPKTTFSVTVSHDGHDDRGQRKERRPGGGGGTGRGGNGRGGRGAGGGGRGSRGGRGGPREPKQEVSQTALDDDMDAYMAARG